MNKENNYIVFQCYGQEGIFYECALALLSLGRWVDPGDLENMEIWIYTDQAEWFGWMKGCSLPLHFRQLDQETLRSWRGRIDFVHRVKIEVLKDFTRERKGNVLYADTDVVFTQPIKKMWEGIEDGRLYMHVMEGNVKGCRNPVLRKLDQFLKKNYQQSINGREVREMSMWNAGLLGFHTKYALLLDDILAFTDRVYTHFPKHVVEQFAFSAYFQQTGMIKSGARYVLHYWNLKEARAILSSFFRRFDGHSWNDLVAVSELIQIPVLLQDKVNYYRNLSIKDKMLKKQWKPDMPDWDEQLKQL